MDTGVDTDGAGIDFGTKFLAVCNACGPYLAISGEACRPTCPKSATKPRLSWANVASSLDFPLKSLYEFLAALAVSPTNPAYLPPAVFPAPATIPKASSTAPVSLKALRDCNVP